MTERKRKRDEKTAAPRGRVRAVADMLPDIGGAAFRRFGFVQSSVVSRWGEIVGPRYAEVSAPESIRFPAGKRSDGVLTLTVESAHAPMLQHVTPAIIERVNRFFGYAAVTRISLRQGSPFPVQPRKAPASIKPVPADVGDSLRSIVDPELRECLTALAVAVASTTGAPLVDREPT